MPIKHLGEHVEWLLEQNGRDLELQDTCRSEVIDGDWKPLINEAKANSRASRSDWYSRAV